MQLYRIEISELAAQDLEDIGDYIAFTLKNSRAAVNTIRGIRKKINTLKHFPERNGLDKDIRLAAFGVRAELYRSYKIYYIVRQAIIYVVRILHRLVNGRVWLYQALSKEKTVIE